MEEFKLKLDFKELLFLDGKVNEETQKIIDFEKAKQNTGLHPEFAKAVIKAVEKGELKWSFKSIKSCKYCDKKARYSIHSRSGKWHRKGEINIDKPIYWSGVEFFPGFINFVSLGDMCVDCFNQHIKSALTYIIENDLKIEIQKNSFVESKYRKDNVRECHSCKKEFYESQMSTERTLMGNGYFKSGCPHCGATSGLFCPSHKHTNKFIMRKISEEQKTKE